ncbi:MAG: hypothetical protein ACPG8W_19800 [Candidatus Promineifilaceae bacterium]
MSDLIVTFVLFVFALLIFHGLLLTRWRNKSIYFWKATDYIWYLIAIVSLATVALSYQHDETNQEVKVLEQLLSAEYDSHQAWLFNLINIELQDTILMIEEASRVEDSEQIEPSLLTARYKYLTELQLTMAESRPYSEYTNTIEKEIKLASHFSGYIIQSDLAEMLQEGIELEEELAAVTISVSRFKVPDQIVYFTPFVLAINLALRITKVTAETYVQRKQQA